MMLEQVKEVLIFRLVGHEISSSALKRRTPLGCFELARPMFKPSPQNIRYCTAVH
jgi:hypothetical protein